MLFTLTNWNTLIQAANIKRQQAIDASCVAPPLDLEEVEDPHLLSITDFTGMQTFLKIMCDDGSFSDVPNYWSQQVYNELADHILNVEPCNCCQSGTVEGERDDREYSIIGYTSSGLLSNMCATKFHETEGVAAALVAVNEWETLENMLIARDTEENVNAQIAVLNVAASDAWDLATLAETQRHYLEPRRNFINTESIKTSNPVLVQGTWHWCHTHVDVMKDYLAPNVNCGALTYLPIDSITDSHDSFKTTPSGLPILYNLGASSSSMFYYNAVLGCITTPFNNCSIAQSAINNAPPFKLNVDYITAFTIY